MTHRSDPPQTLAHLAQSAYHAQTGSSDLRVQALGRLAGGLAHDFNNLLGVIGNCAHLIQRDAPARPDVAAPLAATLRAVEAGRRLTQNLTRLAGIRPMRPQAVDLNRLFSDFEEFLGSVVGDRIAVHVAVATATPAIQVDAGELELAIIHLALNARDETVQAGTIWLRARPARDDEISDMPGVAYVLIAVSNDGGAEPATDTREAVPCYSSAELGRVAGPDLYHVRVFAQQSGGRASLETAAGGGTTVSLLLPAASSATTGTHDGSGAPSPGMSELASEPLRDMRVLLVEDNNDLGEVTAALLRACGAQVHREPDATAALERLRCGPPPDVVLTDIVMPGSMDGIAMAREIRRSDSRLPVVLISGYTTMTPSPGEFPMLNKPCSPEEMVSALTQAVGSIW